MTKYYLKNCRDCGAVIEMRQITETRFLAYEFSDGITHKCERFKK